MTQRRFPDADDKLSTHADVARSQSLFFTPGSALLVSSLPLGLGAYLGYRRALNTSPPTTAPVRSGGGLFGVKGSSIFEQIMHPGPELSPSQNCTHPIQHPKPRVVSATPPPILAARALALGSLVSLSATSLLISAIFYASDCHSVDELISSWRAWGPQKLHQLEASLENAFGIPFGKDRRTAKMEYERAVEGMTEEQELDYVKNREIRWDDYQETDVETKR